MQKVPFITLEQAQQIIADVPTPFHLYDEKGIRENARRLYKAFSWNKGFKEYFAVKATPNPYLMQILKEEGVLLLFEKGTICRRFDISLGKGFSVPAGEFKVGAKLGYPNYELNGTFYKMGTAGNTLGSRWIELKNAEGVPVSGICGESMLKPERAEKPLFFSLKNTDINEIFGLLAEGSEVKVK